MKKLLLFIVLSISLPCFAAGGTCPASVPSGITSCFYVSKSGTASNSNTGTTESTEWLSAPGMASATGTPAGHTPSAGEGYIFRGNDTWTASDLEWIYSGSWGSGNSTHPVYFGVDKTWYSGASWGRPIFTCGNATCSSSTKGKYITLGNTSIQYIIIDNFEFTGLHTLTEQQYLSFGGSYGIAENNYCHGWDHIGASSDNGVCIATQSSVLGLLLANNVCDGSDTTKDMMGCWGSTAGADSWEEMSGNLAQWVTNGQNGSICNAHDNYTAHIPISFNPGHQNGWQITGAASGCSNVLFWNNALTDVQSGGSGQYWWGQGNNTGITWYEFNNLLWATSAGNCVDFSQSTSSGTHNIFNNTLECGSVANGLAAVMNAAGATLPLVLNLTNNHCLTSISGSCANTPSGSVTFSETNDLAQTTTQADANSSPHYDQYTESQNPPLSPVASTNSTVQAGVSIATLCSTVSGINSVAGTACLNSTGFSCTYNTSNHTMSCPAITEIARSSTPDIGAYEYQIPTGAVSQSGVVKFTGTVTVP